MSVEEGAEGAEIEISGFVLSEHDLMATVTRVAELARDRVSADMAGVTVISHGGPRTWAYTDPDTVFIDGVQYDTGVGPCVDAVRLQTPLHIDDTARDDRWPEFATAARARGVCSTLSMPIAVHDEAAFGAFNLYSRQRNQFADQPTYQLSLFVDQAAVLLLNAREFWDARTTVEGLQVAMQSRATIEQAVGILMAPGGRTPEQAFQMLVRASQRENRKLRVIATEIVERAMKRRPSEG